MTPIKLSPTESILGVIPLLSSGPGWQNEPTFVIIGNAATGNYRSVCIQPHERSDRMATLWRVAAIAHEELMRCVKTTKE